MLPPLDDELARAASEFETLEELRASVKERIRTLLEDEVETRFRSDAVDELVKASRVEPAPLVVEVRTRELLNAFLRQLESRGIDPTAYLRMSGISAAELERTLWAEAAHSIARELVLEGAAEKLGIEVDDDDLRTELREGGESDEEIEEFLRPLRLTRASRPAPAPRRRSDRRRGQADLQGARGSARAHLDTGEGSRSRTRKEAMDPRQH